MGVTTIASEIRKRLGHEGRTHPVLLRNCLDHVLEKYMSVRCDQRVVEVPVHFKLTVRIFVIVLVRVPTELNHGVTDLTDDVVSPHQSRLVVTGFFLGVVRI